MDTRKEKEIKRIQIRKREIKLSLFADNMILYIENPESAAKNLLEHINECSKFAGHKIINIYKYIKIYKSFAFLYSKDKLSEREIKKTIQFTITSKGIQYLRINLRK